MKLLSNINQSVMKNLLVSLLLLVSISSIGQTSQKVSASADPKLGQIVLTDLYGTQLDPEALEANQVIRLKIPVSNLNLTEQVPAGSAQIKIGFGSKLQLDPSFDLNAAGMSSMFTWSASNNSGQLVIVGDLTGQMPVDLEDVYVAFKVKSATLGASTITANFLITNHNSPTILSDADPSNNLSFLHYTVAQKTTAPPVIRINDVARGACAINVVFNIDKEINLSRFDIEASKDGINFVKVGEMPAMNQLSYRTSFSLNSAIEAQTLLVRVRSVDVNGNYLYSVPVSVSGTCEKVAPWSVSVYPNPAVNVKSVVISTAAEFKGKYKVTMYDESGQMIQTKDFQLDRVQNFTYNFGVIANGHYLLQLVNVDGSQSGTLKFEKL
jgi:hypothetical protein